MCCSVHYILLTTHCVCYAVQYIVLTSAALCMLHCFLHTLDHCTLWCLLHTPDPIYCALLYIQLPTVHYKYYCSLPSLWRLTQVYDFFCLLVGYHLWWYIGSTVHMDRKWLISFWWDSNTSFLNTASILVTPIPSHFLSWDQWDRKWHVIYRIWIFSMLSFESISTERYFLKNCLHWYMSLMPVSIPFFQQ